MFCCCNFRLLLDFLCTIGGFETTCKRVCRGTCNWVRVPEQPKSLGCCSCGDRHWALNFPIFLSFILSLFSPVVYIIFLQMELTHRVPAFPRWTSGTAACFPAAVQTMPVLGGGCSLRPASSPGSTWLPPTAACLPVLWVRPRCVVEAFSLWNAFVVVVVIVL